MMTVLTTARLRLRPVAEQDEDLFIGLYMDAEIMSRIGPPLSEQKARRAFELTLERGRMHPPRMHCWHITSVDDDQALGIIGLILLPKTDLVEIGLLLLPQFHGKGFAPEAMEAVCDFGFNQCDYQAIVGLPWPTHSASLRILQKTGFEPPRPSELEPGKLECIRYRPNGM